MLIAIVLLVMPVGFAETFVGSLYVTVSGRAWHHVRWLLPVGSLALGLLIYVFGSGLEHIKLWHVATMAGIGGWLWYDLRRPATDVLENRDAVLVSAVAKSTTVLTALLVASVSAMTRHDHL